MDHLTILLNTSALLTSLAAAAAAIFTYMQARNADSTLQAQLFLSFSDRYGTPEMGKSLRLLLNWRRLHPSDFADVWYDKYTQGEKEGLELEEARRVVNRFFVDIGRLSESGQITRKLTYVLLGHLGLDVYYEICHPMWKKMYNESYADYVKILKTIRSSYGTLPSWDHLPQSPPASRPIAAHPPP